MSDTNATATRKPLFAVNQVTKYYTSNTSFFFRNQYHIPAVDTVSFSINHGDTIGLVGESGCGKTTIGRLLLHLIPPSSGSVLFEGQPINALNKENLRAFRKKAQIIFQNHTHALNPRHTIHTILSEPFIIHTTLKKHAITERINELLNRVGLQSDCMYRYPLQLSGGQRQRISIARAIALDPTFIVADEPVSSLDVSIQAHIINLLMDIQKSLRLSMLFISHDLTVVHYLCQRIIVMYCGKIMEMGTVNNIYRHPAHPYTKTLIAAARLFDDNRSLDRMMNDTIQNVTRHASGCVFAARCPQAQERCRTQEPRLSQYHDTDWYTACHYADFKKE